MCRSMIPPRAPHSTPNAPPPCAPPCAPHGVPHALSRAFPHVFPYAFPHVFPYAFPHVFPYAFPHVFPYAFPHVFPYAFPHVFPHAFPHVFSYAFPHVFPYAFPHVFPHAFPHVFPYALPHALPHALPLALPRVFPRATGGLASVVGERNGHKAPPGQGLLRGHLQFHALLLSALAASPVPPSPCATITLCHHHPSNPTHAPIHRHPPIRTMRASGTGGAAGALEGLAVVFGGLQEDPWAVHSNLTQRLFADYVLRTQAARPWVHATAYAAFVNGSDREAFERRMRCPLVDMQGRPVPRADWYMDLRFWFDKHHPLDARTHPSYGPQLTRVKDTGGNMLTSPYVLSNGHPGMAMITPVFKGNVTMESAQRERRAAFMGVIAASVDFNQLADFIILEVLRQGAEYSLEVYDVTATAGPRNSSTSTALGPYLLYGVGDLPQGDPMQVAKLIPPSNETMLQPHRHKAVHQINLTDSSRTYQLWCRFQGSDEAHNVTAIFLGLIILVVAALLAGIGVSVALNTRRVHDKIEAEKVLKETAQAAERNKSAFIASTAHEMRTPINGMEGMLKQLNEGGLDERQREDEGTALEEAGRILRLVNSVLDVCKAEAGRLHLESLPFDLRSWLRDVLHPHVLAAQELGLNLTWHVDGDVPGVLLGDCLRLQQVLDRIVENAIKFTSSGGVCVRLQCLPPDTHIPTHLLSLGCLLAAPTPACSSPAAAATTAADATAAATTAAAASAGAASAAVHRNGVGEPPLRVLLWEQVGQRGLAWAIMGACSEPVLQRGLSAQCLGCCWRLPLVQEGGQEQGESEERREGGEWEEGEEGEDRKEDRMRERGKDEEGEECEEGQEREGGNTLRISTQEQSDGYEESWGNGVDVRPGRSEVGDAGCTLRGAPHRVMPRQHGVENGGERSVAIGGGNGDERIRRRELGRGTPWGPGDEEEGGRGGVGPCTCVHGTRAPSADGVSEAGRFRAASAAAAAGGGGMGWWRGAVGRWWRGRGREEGMVVEAGGDRRCVVLLTCEDTGCGISEEEQRHVFQAFMQTRAHGGSGMSLHLCRQLVSRFGQSSVVALRPTSNTSPAWQVSLMGGSIGLLSTEGHGTTLHVALPMPVAAATAAVAVYGNSTAASVDVSGPASTCVPSSAAAAAAAGDDTSAVPRAVEAKSARERLKELLQGKAILVVDDNLINRRVAASTLARYGAEVALAESGEAALRLLQARHSFRLVLMDLLMPGLDGFQTAARLRALEAKAHTAQWGVQGGQGAGDAQEGQGWGGDVPAVGKSGVEGVEGGWQRQQRICVVAMSADVDNAVAARATEAGMDGAVQKPLNERALLQVLSTL
ncbi:unnamed protein product [Closterium sp. NIES-65]|nr:unnamed protein product [Closterium sp. NIES-65]